jgi:hypothetical protein
MEIILRQNKRGIVVENPNRKPITPPLQTLNYIRGFITSYCDLRHAICTSLIHLSYIFFQINYNIYKTHMWVLQIQ